MSVKLMTTFKCFREMYWIDVGYDPPALFHASMDGRKLTPLSLEHIGANATVGAESLTVDARQQRLFWAQPSRNLTRVLELGTMTVRWHRLVRNQYVHLDPYD